jgi:dihydrofolate synthase/folylpolyglutamate synthase
MQAFLEVLEARRGIRFGLARVRRCLGALGDPQTKFLTVHVTGTKGKGSTASMLHSILGEGGVRTGLFTSPHLLDFRERFVVDGRQVAEGEMLEAHLAVGEASLWGTIPPLTYFEWSTAMAFWLFARKGVAVAVVEVGLGGRLDATRVAGGPLTLLTRIGYDHQDYLGDTLESIAREKAALIVRGGAAITVPQEEEVIRVIRETAARRKATCRILSPADVLVHATDARGTSFDLLGGERVRRGLHVPLPGRHQATNAALAVAAAEALARRGYTLGDEAIRRGLAATRLPGRLEFVGRDPLTVVDGAHNPEAMEALAAFLGEAFPRQRVTMVLGILRDKDYRSMLRLVLPHAGDLFVAPCRSPRTLSGEALAAAAREAGHRRVEVRPTITAALHDAIRAAGPAGTVLVTGSFFTAAEGMETLDAHQGGA